MDRIKLKPLVLALATAALISGCSSGGGGDSGPTSSTVSGTASKGIIIDGVVKAYKIVDGQIDTTPIAEGSTDDAGKYSLTIDGYNGPLHVVVSAGPTSTMKCDAASGCGATAFGATMPMPSTLGMEAILPAVSGGTVEGHVTPLTHMAAALSKNTFLDQGNIQTAIDKVEEIFDITDLLNTDPIDITDGDSVAAAESNVDGDALKVSFISGAIAELAETDGGGDIDATLNTLANNFAENHGELVYNSADDDGGASDGNTITLAEITTETLNAVEKYETDNSANLNDALMEDEVTALNTTASDPANTDTTTTTVVDISDTELEAAITDAKGVVDTLRTWGTQLDKMDQAGELFGDEIEMAETASTMAMETVGQGLEYATMAAAYAYVKSTHTTGLNAAIAGKTISLTEDNETTTISFDCDLQYSADSGMGIETGEYAVVGNTLYADADSVDGDNFNATFSSAMPAVGNTVNYTSETDFGGTESGSATIAAIQEYQVCNLTPSTDLADYMDEDEPWMSASGTVTITGSDVSVMGTITDDGTDSGTPGTSTVEMDYSFPALSGSSFSVSMDGSVSNGDMATLTIHDTSSASVTLAGSLVLPNQLLEDTDIPAINSASFALAVTLAQGTVADDGSTVTNPVSFHGDISLAGVKSSGSNLDDMTANPSNLSMAGTFSSQSGKSFAAEFNATMANASTFVPVDTDGDETTSNWRRLSGNLTFAASHLVWIDPNDANIVETLPDATIEIEATRTGYEAAEGSVTISYDDISILLSASGNGATDEFSGSMVVTDTSDAQSPVQLTITPNPESDKLQGSVSVGSRVVGSINEDLTDGLLIINYVDGTFESVTL